MKTTRLKNVVRRSIKEAEERKAQGGVEYIGLPTGFNIIDRMTGGLRKKTVTVVAARPGQGKTAFGMTMGLNVSRMSKKVLFISMEMDASLLALRVLSTISGVAADNIERGKLSDAEMSLVAETEQRIEPYHFDIVDGTLDSTGMLQSSALYQQSEGLDLVIIDYLTLFSDDGDNDNERITKISRNMVLLAHELDIPVVALAQLNRQVESREGNVPMLHDLRGSGSIEQDAHNVIFLMRPHVYTMIQEGAGPVDLERDAKIIVAKNRQGRTGSTPACFHATRMTWTQEETTPKVPKPTGAQRR